MSGLIHQRFHGWRIVGFCTVSQFMAMGFSIYLLSLYIEPMATTFDVSPGVIGSGMGLFYLATSLTGPLVGSWVDRGHMRSVLLGGTLLFALSFVVMALAPNIWYVALACIFLLAPGVCMIGVLPCATMLVNWFEKRQALALGVAALGISFGGFFAPPLAAYLITNIGWQHSMLVFAAMIVAILLPLIWALVVGKPADVGQFPDGVEPPPIQSQPSSSAPPSATLKELMTQKTFWYLTLSVGLLSLCSILLVTYIVPLARERGLSTETAALLVSAYAGSSLIGKFLLGWLGDKYAKRSVFILIQVFATVGWLPMLLVNSVAGLMVSVVCVGLAVGGLTPIWGSLIAAYFGSRVFGRVKGAMTLAMLVCTVVPGPLGGLIYSFYGSYAASFWILWGVLPIALVCTLLLPGLHVTPTALSPQAKPYISGS